MEVYSYLVDYCMYANIAIPQCTTIEHEYGLQGHQLILSLPVAVYYNAVSTAPAPVGRAFGLKYRLADLLHTISRASSRFTRASSRFTRQ